MEGKSSTCKITDDEQTVRVEDNNKQNEISEDIGGGETTIYNNNKIEEEIDENQEEQKTYINNEQYKQQNQKEDEQKNLNTQNKSSDIVKIQDEDFEKEHQQNDRIIEKYYEKQKKKIQEQQQNNEIGSDYLDTDDEEEYNKIDNQAYYINPNQDNSNNLNYRYHEQGQRITLMRSFMQKYGGGSVEEEILKVIEDFLLEIQLDDALRIDFSCLQSEFREVYEFLIVWRVFQEKKELNEEQRQLLIKQSKKNFSIIVDRDEFQNDRDAVLFKVHSWRILMVYHNYNQEYERQHQDIYTYLANYFNCEMDDVVSYEFAEIEDIDEVKKKSKFFKIQNIYFQSSLPYYSHENNIKDYEQNKYYDSKGQEVNLSIKQAEQKIQTQKDLKNGLKRLMLALNYSGFKFSLYMQHFFDFAWENSDRYIQELTESYLEQVQKKLNELRIKVDDKQIEQIIENGIDSVFNNVSQDEEIKEIDNFLQKMQEELKEDDQD